MLKLPLASLSRPPPFSLHIDLYFHICINLNIYIFGLIVVLYILKTFTIINIAINLWETSGGGSALTVLEILNHPAPSCPSQIGTLPYPLETPDSLDETLHFSGAIMLTCHLRVLGGRGGG